MEFIGKKFSVKQLVVAIFIVFVNIQLGKGDRRDLVNLFTIMAIKTGRNPLDFNNYGHFCGYLGQGIPIDSTDGCCQDHDRCYNSVAKLKDCSKFSDKFIYFMSYKWEKLDGGNISCVLEDSSNHSLCAFELCHCDLNLATCLSSSSYNPHNHRTTLWRTVEAFLSNTVTNVADWLFPKS